jgi:predicted nucleic acid-binding protein
MSAKAFFDTNVLLYAFSDDELRSETAKQVVGAGGAISVQVLNEFVAVCRRKLHRSWSEIEKSTASILDMCSLPLAITLKTHQAAFKISKRYDYKIYDAMVLASAIEAGCAVLFTEDMQDGQKIESVTLRNPFKQAV